MHSFTIYDISVIILLMKWKRAQKKLRERKRNKQKKMIESWIISLGKIENELSKKVENKTHFTSFSHTQKKRGKFTDRYKSIWNSSLFSYRRFLSVVLYVPLLYKIITAGILHFLVFLIAIGSIWIFRTHFFFAEKMDHFA